MAILKEIHDKFDTFPRYPYSDHSLVDRIKISTSLKTGNYEITTFPGGCGSAYDGFVIELCGVEQLIGGDEPRTVKVGRNYGGLIALNIDAVEPQEDGMVVLNGTVAGEMPNEEGSIAPSQSDYVLFKRLHAEIQEFRPTLQRLLDMFIPGKEDVAHFEFDFTGGSVGYDYDKKIATHVLGSKILVSDIAKRRAVYVNLDATARVPFGEEIGDFVYRKGDFLSTVPKPVEPGITKLELVTTPLTQEQLQAFTSLHNELKKLYQP